MSDNGSLDTALGFLSWENLRADFVLMYAARSMEIECQVITHTNLRKRFLELRPQFERRHFEVCVDMLTDQGYLEDKVGKLAGGEHDGWTGHLYYVYDPAEGYADQVVAKVCQLRGMPLPVAPQPRLPATETGCGRPIGGTERTCGYDDYRCSQCLKDRK